jgi:hypothetical protein
VTQTQKIKAHLLKHNSITPIEALRRYGCFRLAARIWDLHREGFSTITCIASRKGKRYAKYVMG